MTEEAELAEKAIAEMEKTVMDAGWDGEWYLLCSRSLQK